MHKPQEPRSTGAWRVMVAITRAAYMSVRKQRRRVTLVTGLPGRVPGHKDMRYP